MGLRCEQFDRLCSTHANCCPFCAVPNIRCLKYFHHSCFFALAALYLSVLVVSTHTFLFCRCLLLGYWLLLVAALSLVSACVESFAFLDLVFRFQPSGLQYFRERALSCYFSLVHSLCLAALIIRESRCWSCDCFCCPFG